MTKNSSELKKNKISAVHGMFKIEREMDFRVGGRERGTGSLMDALERSLES